VIAASQSFGFEFLCDAANIGRVIDPAIAKATGAVFRGGFPLSMSSSCNKMCCRFQDGIEGEAHVGQMLGFGRAVGIDGRCCWTS
jgi:hypothetical protein